MAPKAKPRKGFLAPYLHDRVSVATLRARAAAQRVPASQAPLHSPPVAPPATHVVASSLTGSSSASTSLTTFLLMVALTPAQGLPRYGVTW